MKLLVIRHARAENAKEFAKSGAVDDLRPLTDDGMERMRLGAIGLHRIVPEIDVMASSHLVRARQTADIVAAEFGGLDVVELAELHPDAPPTDLVKWLRNAGSRETIAVAGHRPQLTALVGWLLAGDSDPVVEIKKGAAVLLEVHDLERKHGAGSATLLWSLQPRHLRELGSAPH